MKKCQTCLLKKRQRQKKNYVKVNHGHQRSEKRREATRECVKSCHQKPLYHTKSYMKRVYFRPLRRER